MELIDNNSLEHEKQEKLSASDSNNLFMKRYTKNGICTKHARDTVAVLASQNKKNPVDPNKLLSQSDIFRCLMWGMKLCYPLPSRAQLNVRSHNFSIPSCLQDIKRKRECGAEEKRFPRDTLAHHSSIFHFLFLLCSFFF